VVSTGTGPCPFLPCTGWSSSPATVDLQPSDDDNRRVLAVVTYLSRWPSR